MPERLLNQRLNSLRLPSVLREYGKRAKQAAAEGWNHVQFLARLIELERRMIERRIKADCSLAGDLGRFKGLHRVMHQSFSRQFQSQDQGHLAQSVNVVLVDARVALPVFGRWSDANMAIYHRPDPDRLGLIGA